MQNKSSKFFWWFFLLIVFLLGGWKLALAFFLLVSVVFPLFFILIIAYLIFSSIIRTKKINLFTADFSLEHNDFIDIFVACAAKLIKSDSKIEQVEIQTVRNFFSMYFGYDQNGLIWVETLLKQHIKKDSELDEIISRINQKWSYEQKLFVVDFLYQLALSDFELHAKEKGLLDELATKIGLEQNDYQNIYLRYVRSVSLDAQHKYYAVLGVNKDASQDEIKSAYRNLAKQFHPDVVAYLGDDIKKASEKKMQEITEAYEVLKKD